MQLLYQDDDILVCVKPVGMDCEPGPGSLPEALGGDVYPVHRLDRNVGGVMVYARSRPAAAALSAAIQAGTVKKEYLAIVHGTPDQPQGTLEDLLWKDSRKNKVFPVTRMRRGVKQAKLDYRALACLEGKTLVQIRLHTGRSHQIRVQFASRAMPLVGDHKYGSRDSATAPVLFSFRLTLPHPSTHAQMQFTALPDGSVWAPFRFAFPSAAEGGPEGKET